MKPNSNRYLREHHGTYLELSLLEVFIHLDFLLLLFRVKISVCLLLFGLFGLLKDQFGKNYDLHLNPTSYFF